MHSGCSKEEESGSFLMQKLSSFDLPLTDNMRVNSFCVRSFHDRDGKDFLYYLNGVDNSIYVYDVANRSIDHKMRIEREGPQGTGRVVGFSIIGKDSILLSSGGYPSNFLVGKSGQIIDKFEYKWEDSQPPTFSQWDSWYYRDASVKDGVVYFPQEINFLKIDKDYFEQNPIAAYDLRTRKSRLLSFKYAEDYFEKNLPRPMIFSGDENYVYFSMIGNHTIYRIDKMTESAEEYEVKSKYITNKIQNRNKVAGMDDVLRYNATNPRYMGIYDDPYRNVTYRLVILPPEDLGSAEEKFVQLDRFPERFSIIVMDKEMKILGEHLFPNNIYHPAGIFVSSEGLCVPKTHPGYYVENGKETAMTIDVFNFTVE
ncbi:protein of unknown function [Neolewinella agarilytica]|uniref:DUF4221 domain-containing protein n=2 Tax=Neolewinella agarilytica TaxID=478744 RepID=A0A1H9JVP6_9BACT|nr:protein of unknown function [Neolewinella agarilytica]